MKRQVKTLLVILAVLVLCAAGILLLNLLPKDKPENKKSQSAASDIVLCDKDLNDVESIKISNRNDDYLIQRNSKGELEIPELENLPQNANLYRDVAKSAAKLSARAVISENPEDIGAFGFENPNAKVKVTFKDKTTLSFEVGNKTANRKDYYIMVEGDNKIYASTQMDNFVSFTKLNFVDTTVVNEIDLTGPLALESLTLAGTYHQKPVVVVQNPQYGKDEGESRYKLTSPKDINANDEKVDNIVKSISSFFASSVAAIYPTQQQLKEYGLDLPFVTADYVIDNKKISLAVGKLEGSTYYVKRPDRPIVYAVPEHRLEWVKLKYSDIASDLILRIQIDKVKAVAVEGQGMNYRFELSGEGPDLQVKLGDKLIDTQNFRKWFAVILTTRAEEYITEPIAIEPALTITYEYRDSSLSATRVQFTPYESRRYYYTINGQGDVLILSEHFDKIVRDTNKLIKGEPISTLPGE